MKRTLTAALALTLVAGAAMAQPDFNDHRVRGDRGDRSGDQGEHHHDNNDGGHSQGQTSGQTSGQSSGQPAVLSVAPAGATGRGPQGPQVQLQGVPAVQSNGGQGGHHNWQGQVGGGYQGQQTQQGGHAYRGYHGQSYQGYQGQPYQGQGESNGASNGQSWRHNNVQLNGHNANDGRHDWRGPGHNGREHHNGRGGQDSEGWHDGQNGQDWDHHDDRGFDTHPPRDRDHGRSWFQEGRFHESFEARHRYRAPFYRPYGWSYQRWSYGEHLPFGWFAPNYYLNGGAYGLPAPPVGCEWVRQGGDAVLVDVWTGEVLSVYYDAFY